jgi:hypothetical protein
VLAAAVGFAALVVLAFHVTLGYDRRASRAAGETRRASARGWPLAWNYLAAGLVLPAAVRTLRRPPESDGQRAGAGR